MKRKTILTKLVAQNKKYKAGTNPFLQVEFNEEDKEQLGVEFWSLWHLLCHSQHVLLSGRAGSGKSFLLKQLMTVLNDAEITYACTAPTGVAANNIGGTSLHSYLGLWLCQESVDYYCNKLDKGKFGKTRTNFKDLQLLIIDEISMCDAQFFQKLSQIVCHVRHQHRATPFGSLKVLCVGDFLQLQPVHGGFVFNTPEWTTMKFAKHILHRNYRQQEDDYFQKVLTLTRTAQHKDSAKIGQFLEDRVGVQPPVNCTRLCAKRIDQDRYNDRAFNALPGREYTFIGEMSFKKTKKNKPMDPSLLKMLQSVHAVWPFVVDKEVVLKVGAVVMCRTNKFREVNSLCNGSIGIVQQVFPDENEVLVLFPQENNLLFSVGAVEFQHQVGTITQTLKQLPLTLAWAFTIHKAQGLTLSNVLLDRYSFTAGQFYVALSRVRFLRQVFLLDGHCHSKQNPWRCLYSDHAAREFEQDHMFFVVMKHMIETFRRNPYLDLCLFKDIYEFF